MSRFPTSIAVACLACLAFGKSAAAAATQPAPDSVIAEPRLRLIIETDAGGDPDDEQSLVRFLLYANEWDIEGIVANRPQARDGENRNPERTGLGIVGRLIGAYSQCWSNLVSHDPRYPAAHVLLSRTVGGGNETEAAVALILAAVDRDDARPVWYSDWGTDHGAATNNLRRVLDRVLRERGPAGYARFKSRLRLASADAFGPHTTAIAPPFPLWVDTWRPEMGGSRWYHRFSAITAKAGGFDIVRDALTGHGPLGALYPTNTTHPQKEGDTMSFLYLLPNGMNVPEEPGWGGWAGRHGPSEVFPGKPYFWANQVDAWNGSTNRDNTLLRWAADVQNDFHARLDWCVQPRTGANHPPQVALAGLREVVLRAGEEATVSVAASTDPDGDALAFEWIHYPEAGGWRGPVTFTTNGPILRLAAPNVSEPESIHFVARVSDQRPRPLARYARQVITVLPATTPSRDRQLPSELIPFFTPPPGTEARTNRDFILTFDDGRPVTRAADWPARRRELRAVWERELGPWPPLITAPHLDVLHEERRESFLQQRIRLEIAPDQTGEGWFLTPDGPGPFPAVLVVYYEPETSVGLNPKQSLRDFALELTRRGFVTLSLGTPGGNAWKPDTGSAICQPLSFHAYVAANAWHALAQHPRVDPSRIGVTGHSYGGKWALFAAALWDRFAAVAVSDPGIAFDESRPNINYWEPWYLGLDKALTRKPGVPTAENPRTGAYARLQAGGRDLDEIHALISPRPFLVSGGAEDPPQRWRALGPALAVNRLLGYSPVIGLTSRSGHDPTRESNEQLYGFFVHFLKSSRTVPKP